MQGGGVFAAPVVRGSSAPMQGKGVSFLSIRQILFFGSFMAVIMSLCMSLAMALINVGPGSGFLGAWLSGWGIGFLVSLPFSFFVPPLIQKIMEKFHI
jgi:hypothetical protein